MFFAYDPVYLLVIFLPFLLLSLLASVWLKVTYARYSRVANRQGVTGAEAAQLILRAAGVHDVRVAEVGGWLSDHYSPKEKVLRLSPQNFSGTSIAAVGVAAHEAGHAIQHAQRYVPLVIRNAAVPVASIGSNLGFFLIIIGLFLSSGAGAVSTVAIIGLLLYASVAVFQLVNLPVEFDASRRALQVLPETGILDLEEARGARRVLTAAAMTYVVATAAAVAEVLYWAWRLGLIGGQSRRD